jgi:low temperature requirement protein LtrA
VKGLVVPEKTEDYTADPVELFFDLAFVFAFSQIVHMLVVHPDWEHIAKAGLIFLLIWLPWTQFTWAANAVPGNQRSVRLGFLVATAATVPMGAAVETAFDGSGPLFVLPLAVIYLMALAVMLAGIETGTPEHTAVLRYFRPNLIAMVVLVIGGFLQDEWRIGAWILAILIVIWATITTADGAWHLRPGHFAERHALIIIVALGEVIVALGLAVAEPLSGGEGFSAEIVVALVATGVAAGMLWWSYFDRVQPSLEHRAEELEGQARGWFFRDAYTYAHAPIVAGIILIAVGFEEAALHPTSPVPVAYRAILFGGVGLFVLGIALAAYRAFHAVAAERLAVLVIIGGVLFAGGSIDAVWLIVIIDVIGIAGLTAEHYRIEKRPGDSKIHHSHA